MGSVSGAAQITPLTESLGVIQGKLFSAWEDQLSFEEPYPYYANTPQLKKRARKVLAYLKRLKKQYYGKGGFNEGSSNG